MTSDSNSVQDSSISKPNSSDADVKEDKDPKHSSSPSSVHPSPSINLESSSSDPPKPALTTSSIPLRAKARALICSMLLQLMMGYFASLSNSYIYIASYLRQFNPGQVDPHGKSVIVIMPIWIVCISLASVVSVKLANKIGYWHLNLIAFLWFCANNLAMVFLKSYWGFIIVFGVGSGLATGLAYLPALYIAWTYFPARKSLITGILLFTAGVGTCCIAPLVTRFVNPNNLKPDDLRVVSRVPDLFKAQTCVFLLLTSFGTLLMPDPWGIKKSETKGSPDPSDNLNSPTQINGIRPQKRSQRFRNVKKVLSSLRKKNENEASIIVETGFAEELQTAPEEIVMAINQFDNQQIQDLTVFIDGDEIRSDQSPEEKDRSFYEEAQQKIQGDLIHKINKTESITLKQALLSPQFLQLGLMAFSSTVYIYFVMVSWKHNFSKYLSFNDRQLSLLLSTGALSNSISRLVCGALLQKIEFKKLYICMNCVICFSAIGIHSVLATFKNHPLSIVCLGMAYGCLGTVTTIFPSTCLKVFGVHIGAQVYPFIHMTLSLAFTTAYLLFRLIDSEKTVFLILAGLASVGLMAGFSFNETLGCLDTSVPADSLKTALAEVSIQMEEQANRNRNAPSVETVETKTESPSQSRFDSQSSNKQVQVKMTLSSGESSQGTGLQTIPAGVNSQTNAFCAENGSKAA